MGRLWIALLASLLVMPALAEEPADSAIKAALYDIGRAEADLPSLTPSRAPNIKRMQRMLGLTRDRLEASTNQDHPSYIEAAARLARLEQALADLAAGRMPGEAAAPAPAPVTTEEAPAGSVDPAVAAAVKELARIAGELDGLTAADKALLQRTRIQLDTVAQRLGAVGDQQVPAWGAAAQTYNALAERLNGLIADASGGGGAPAAAPAEQAEADPAIGRAGREIGMIDSQLRSSGRINLRLAERFLRDLARIDGDLQGVGDKSHPDWAATASRHQALKSQIVSGVARILAGGLDGVIDTIDQLQPVQFLIAETVEGVRRGLLGVREQTEALQSPDNADVQSLIANIERISGAFEELVAKAEAEYAALGDVNGRLAAIEERVHGLRVPRPLSAEAGEPEIRAFAEAIAAAAGHIDEDLAFLNSVSGKVPLTVDESNRFNRNLSVLSHEKPRAIAAAIAQSNQAVDARVESFERTAGYVEETDPGDRGHVANRLLGEGDYEETVAQLAEGVAAVALAAAYDATTTRTDAPDRGAQRARLEQATAAWEEKHGAALGGARMPEAQSTDPELLAAAAGVLAEEGHDYARMVINYDLHHKEKRTGDIDVGTVTTTVTVYHYVWDEFQVTTAEAEDGKVYLYANSFRYYYQGDNNTVTNRWYMSGRFRSHQILADNIDK